MTEKELFNFMLGYIEKKIPITDDIRMVSDDILDVIGSIDSRITLYRPQIYLIDAPEEKINEAEIQGFYFELDDSIYISNFRPVDSLTFYHNLLHETLHFLHHYKKTLCPIRFTTEFEEALTEYLTLWILVNSNRFQDKMSDKDFIEELYSVLFTISYTADAIFLKQLLSALNLNEKEVFFRYAIADYEYFIERFPKTMFEPNYLYFKNSKLENSNLKKE